MENVLRFFTATENWINAKEIDSATKLKQQIPDEFSLSRGWFMKMQSRKLTINTHGYSTN